MIIFLLILVILAILFPGFLRAVIGLVLLVIGLVMIYFNYLKLSEPELAPATSINIIDPPKQFGGLHIESINGYGTSYVHVVTVVTEAENASDCAMMKEAGNGFDFCADNLRKGLPSFIGRRFEYWIDCRKKQVIFQNLGDDASKETTDLSKPGIGIGIGTSTEYDEACAPLGMRYGQ